MVLKPDCGKPLLEVLWDVLSYYGCEYDQSNFFLETLGVSESDLKGPVRWLDRDWKPGYNIRKAIMALERPYAERIKMGPST